MYDLPLVVVQSIPLLAVIAFSAMATVIYVAVRCSSSSYSVEDMPGSNGQTPLPLSPTHIFEITEHADLLRHNLIDFDRNSSHKIFVTKWPRSSHGEIENESQILDPLRHPNIVPLLGSRPRPGYGSQSTGIILPFYKFGAINEYLRTRGRNVRVVYKLIAQIANAVAYMHRRTPMIAHADLKGNNVLVDDNNNAILIDFGLSRVLNEEGFATFEGTGTARYAAIELLNSEDAKITPASDVWSLSMLIYEVLSGKRPFDRHLGVQIPIALRRGVRPPRQPGALFSDTIWSLLQACWQEDPGARPSAQNVALLLDIMYHLASRETSPQRINEALTPHDVDRILRQETFITGSRVSSAFPCKWAGCVETFETLDVCAEHEYICQGIITLPLTTSS